jgi:uncharacterized protein YdcH (DUF465 family)
MDIGRSIEEISECNEPTFSRLSDRHHAVTEEICRQQIGRPMKNRRRPVKLRKPKIQEGTYPERANKPSFRELTNID